MAGATSRLQKAAPCQIAHQRPGAEAPRRGLGRQRHAIGKCTKLGRGNCGDVTQFVRKALPDRIAVFDRREHGAKKQHRPVRILVMPAQHLFDERGRVARDLAHRGAPLQHVAILALHLQAHLDAAHVVEREGGVGIAQERGERGRRSVVLGLGQQERGASLDVTKVDVVAERGADDCARGSNEEYDLGLGIVPGRDWIETRLHAVTHRRHRLRLGEDFRVGSDADLQVLRPGALSDQNALQLGSLVAAGNEVGQVAPEVGRDAFADRLGLLRGTARLLLDDALQHGSGKGDAGSLDGLQVDRGQQPGLVRLAPNLRRVAEDIGQRPDRYALPRARDLSRLFGLAQVAHGRRQLRDVVELSAAHGDDGRALNRGEPDATGERAGAAVARQARGNGHVLGKARHGCPSQTERPQPAPQGRADARARGADRAWLRLAAWPRRCQKASFARGTNASVGAQRPPLVPLWTLEKRGNSPRRLVLLFWAGAVLAAIVGYKQLEWWVPLVLAGAVAGAQFYMFHGLLGTQGAGLEFLFGLILNLAMYTATFSIGRAIGQRRARRRSAKARRGRL